MLNYLVVEDDTEMSALIKQGLGSAGIEISIAQNGNEALIACQSNYFDIIILDVNLPGYSGFEISRRIRAMGIDTPILFLTAQDSLSDKVTGFEVGGDDYLVKPFQFIELEARIKALRRRPSIGHVGNLSYGSLRIELATQRVTIGEKSVLLSPREFSLLALLLRVPDVIYSRKQILDEIWGGSDYVDLNIVDQYVSYLRKKIDKEFGEPLIETIRGVGYRIPKYSA
jgi:DNA-binding response OmpR family regulator